MDVNGVSDGPSRLRLFFLVAGAWPTHPNSPRNWSTPRRYRPGGLDRTPRHVRQSSCLILRHLQCASLRTDRSNRRRRFSALARRPMRHVTTRTTSHNKCCRSDAECRSRPSWCRPAVWRHPPNQARPRLEPSNQIDCGTLRPSASRPEFNPGPLNQPERLVSCSTPRPA